MYRGTKIRMTAGAMSLKLLKRKKKTKKEKKNPQTPLHLEFFTQ